MKTWTNFNRWLDNLKPGHVAVGWAFKMGYIDIRVEVDWDGRFRVDRVYFDDRGVVVNGGVCMALGAGAR